MGKLAYTSIQTIDFYLCGMIEKEFRIIWKIIRKNSLSL